MLKKSSLVSQNIPVVLLRLQKATLLPNQPSSWAPDHPCGALGTQLWPGCSPSCEAHGVSQQMEDVPVILLVK